MAHSSPSVTMYMLILLDKKPIVQQDASVLHDALCTLLLYE